VLQPRGRRPLKRSSGIKDGLRRVGRRIGPLQGAQAELQAEEMRAQHQHIRRIGLDAFGQQPLEVAGIGVVFRRDQQAPRCLGQIVFEDRVQRRHDPRRGAHGAGL